MNEYGFKPYTYYLYHMPTGKKYYGSRIANRCDPEQDLWNKYFSSSDLVEALIKEHGKESFTAKVRKTFDGVTETREYEQRFLRRVKAVEKDDWLNQAYATGPFYNVGPKPSHSEFMKDWWAEHPEQRKRQSELMKGNDFSVGREYTAEEKKQMSDKMKGNTRSKGNKHTEQWKIDNGNRNRGELCNFFGVSLKGCDSPNYGKVQSEETKQKNREAHLGERNVNFGKKNPEHSKRMSGPNNPRFGKPSPNRKPVSTPLGIFESVTLAAIAHNCTDQGIAYRCKHTKGYEYLPKNQ